MPHPIRDHDQSEPKIFTELVSGSIGCPASDHRYDPYKISFLEFLPVDVLQRFLRYHGYDTLIGSNRKGGASKHQNRKGCRDLDVWIPLGNPGEQVEYPPQ